MSFCSFMNNKNNNLNNQKEINDKLITDKINNNTPLVMNTNSLNSTNFPLKSTVISLTATPVISLATTSTNLTTPTMQTNNINSEKPILTLVTNNSLANLNKMKSFNFKDKTSSYGSISTNVSSPINNNNNNNQISIVSLKNTNTTNSNNNNNNNNHLLSKHNVMVANNRININSTSNDLFIKNQSPAKTIVILSKPPSTQTHHQISHNDYQHQLPISDTNNNNLLSFNLNQIKPITLIPLKTTTTTTTTTTATTPTNISNNQQQIKILNLDTNSSDINLNSNQFFMNQITQLNQQQQLKPSNINNNNSHQFETIEISTATIEISDATEEVVCEEEEEEEKEIVEELVVEEEKEKIDIIKDNNENAFNQKEIVEANECASGEKIFKNVNSKENNSNNNNNKLKFNKQKSGITRCICEMKHSDGFMISCDKCLVWQHIACMQINSKKIPQKYNCEKCQPRPVNLSRAKQIQTNYLNDRKLDSKDPKNQENKENKSNKSKLIDKNNKSIKEELIKSEEDDDDLDEDNQDKNKKSLCSSSSYKKVKRNQYSNEFVKFQMSVANNNIMLDQSPSIDSTLLTKSKIDVNNRGSLKKDFVNLNSIKLIKQINEENNIQNENKYKVISSQNIKKDHLLGEYIGKVMLKDEFEKIEFTGKNFYLCHDIKLTTTSNNNIDKEGLLMSSSSTPSSSSSSFASASYQKIYVDSSVYGNLTRFVRKSTCPTTANVCVKYLIDTNGNFHFILQASKHIPKDSEIILFADENNQMNLTNPKMIGKQSKILPKTNLNNNLNRNKRLNSVDSNNSDSKELNDDINNKKSAKIINNNNMNLSREDRKLASYVRVIERLEKQGKRKKELKEQREAAKLLLIQQKTSENDETNNKNDTISSNNEVDQEIEKILVVNNNLPEQEKKTKEITNESANNEIKLKSPDYSFVNLSAQPRPTLHLLQRNLSSPNFYNTNTRKAQEENDVEDKKKLFNPKKHWLKCSSSCSSNSLIETQPPAPTASNESIINNNSNIEFLSQNSNSSSSSNSSSRNSSFTTAPPKKRKHLLFSQSEAQIIESNQIKSEEIESPMIVEQQQEQQQQQQQPQQETLDLSLISNLNNKFFSYFYQEQLLFNNLNNNDINNDHQLIETNSQLEQRTKKVSLAEYRQRVKTTDNNNSNYCTTANISKSVSLNENDVKLFNSSPSSSSSSLISSPRLSTDSTSLIESNNIKNEPDQVDVVVEDEDNNNKSKLKKLLNKIIINNKQAKSTLDNNSNNNSNELINLNLDKFSSKLFSNSNEFLNNSNDNNNNYDDKITMSIVKEPCNNLIEKQNSDIDVMKSNEEIPIKEDKAKDKSIINDSILSSCSSSLINNQNNKRSLSSSSSSSSSSSITSISSVSNDENNHNEKRTSSNKKYHDDNTYDRKNNKYSQSKSSNALSPNRMRKRRCSNSPTRLSSNVNKDHSNRNRYADNYYDYYHYNDSKHKIRSTSPNGNNISDSSRQSYKSSYNNYKYVNSNRDYKTTYLENSSLFKKRFDSNYDSKRYYEMTSNANGKTNRSRSKSLDRNDSHKPCYYKYDRTRKDNDDNDFFNATKDVLVKTKRHSSLTRQSNSDDANYLARRRQLDEMLDEYNKNKTSYADKKRRKSEDRSLDRTTISSKTKTEKECKNSNGSSNSSTMMKNTNINSDDSLNNNSINNYNYNHSYHNSNNEDNKNVYNKKYLPKDDLRFHLNKSSSSSSSKYYKQ